jgi:predicted nucleotide-binding protein
VQTVIDDKIIAFYSWQSWTNQKVNRYFIQKAIEQALNRLKKDSDFELDCALDRDTKDLPGTPEIAESILQKIEKSDLFICDLTITTESINEDGDLRSSPNPNVLIELGYAVAKLGWERIITIMNAAYGNPQKLPFHLKHRRFPIVYNLSKTSANKDADKVKSELSQIISSSIKTALKSSLETKLHPKDERVLDELEHILFHWHMYLVAFLASMKLEPDNNPLNLAEFAVKNRDLSFLKNPSDNFIKSIVSFFSSENLEKISPHYNGEDTWAGNAVNELKIVMDECSFLLQRYADREETIISLVEDIRRSSKQLAGLLSFEGGCQAISNVWSYGLEEFLIAFFQSYGAILKYKGIIEVYDDTNIDEDGYGDF